MEFCLIERIVPFVSFWPLGIFPADLREVWYFLTGGGTAFLWFPSFRLALVWPSFLAWLYFWSPTHSCKNINPAPILWRFLYSLCISYITTTFVCSGVASLLYWVWCHLRGWWRVKVERQGDIRGGGEAYRYQCTTWEGRQLQGLLYSLSFLFGRIVALVYATCLYYLT